MNMEVSEGFWSPSERGLQGIEVHTTVSWARKLH